MKKSVVNFRLIVITDRKLSGKNPAEIINSACKAGVKAVQLREKDLPGSELLSLARKLKIITSETGATLFVNDRLDIALLSEADGLHSGNGGFNQGTVKKFSENLITGKSVHSKKEALNAERDGFDYIMFGPVFRTPAKVKYGSPQGLKILAEISSSVKIPVFAVGGITPERAEKCLAAGAYGVAVIRQVMLAGNIRQTVSYFKKAMGEL